MLQSTLEPPPQPVSVPITSSPAAPAATPTLASLSAQLETLRALAQRDGDTVAKAIRPAQVLAARLRMQLCCVRRGLIREPWRGCR